jgi:hypothetical protein
MAASHWDIIATCEPAICPHNLYDFPSHFPSQRMVVPCVTLALVTRVTLLDLFEFDF